jgi:hypothetical protein
MPLLMGGSSEMVLRANFKGIMSRPKTRRAQILAELPKREAYKDKPFKYMCS